MKKSLSIFCFLVVFSVSAKVCAGEWFGPGPVGWLEDCLRDSAGLNNGGSASASKRVQTVKKAVAIDRCAKFFEETKKITEKECKELGRKWNAYATVPYCCPKGNESCECEADGGRTWSPTAEKCCEKGDKKCICEADNTKQWYQGTTAKEYLNHCCPRLEDGQKVDKCRCELDDKQWYTGKGKNEIVDCCEEGETGAECRCKADEKTWNPRGNGGKGECCENSFYCFCQAEGELSDKECCEKSLRTWNEKENKCCASGDKECECTAKGFKYNSDKKLCCSNNDRIFDGSTFISQKECECDGQYYRMQEKCCERDKSIRAAYEDKEYQKCTCVYDKMNEVGFDKDDKEAIEKLKKRCCLQFEEDPKKCDEETVCKIGDVYCDEETGKCYSA